MGTVITKPAIKQHYTQEIQSVISHGILHSQTAPASGQASLRRLYSQLQQETSGTILRDGRPDAKGPSIHNVCYDEHGPTGSRTQVVPDHEPSRSESARIDPEPTNFLRNLQEEDVPVLLKCDNVCIACVKFLYTNTCSIWFIN